ncbi:hypothetical protein BGZ82_005590, partial [Podila clonocystis]
VSSMLKALESKTKQGRELNDASERPSNSSTREGASRFKSTVSAPKLKAKNSRTMIANRKYKGEAIKAQDNVIDLDSEERVSSQNSLDDEVDLDWDINKSIKVASELE